MKNYGDMNDFNNDYVGKCDKLCIWSDNNDDVSSVCSPVRCHIVGFNGKLLFP